MRHYVAMSIYLMAAFSIVMTIGFSLANKPILHLMNSPEEVFGDVTAYMGIIYAGLIITGAYNALAAFLRALGDSKSPLYFLIISAVINVILDVVFIVAFGMGVEGCGYATVIAQGISAVCCLIYIVKRFPILHLERKDFEICWDSFGRLLKLGIPMGLQFSITAIGTIIVQSAVNIYGPVHMAGFSAAGKIQNIFATVFTAFGATIATYVGQNRGAGKMDRVKQGVRYTQMMVLGWSVFVMFLMFFFGKYLTYLFVDPSEQDCVCKFQFIHIIFFFAFFAKDQQSFAVNGKILLLQCKIQESSLSAFQESRNQINGNSDIIHHIIYSFIFILILLLSAEIIQSRIYDEDFTL